MDFGYRLYAVSGLGFKASGFRVARPWGFKALAFKPLP